MRKLLTLLILFGAPSLFAASYGISWKLPTGCKTCVFALYRKAGACPATVTTITGWTLVTTTQALSATDATPPAGQICEVVRATQGTVTVFSNPLLFNRVEIQVTVTATVPQ